MSATSIEWTDATWNPVRGCSRVSEGCRNCYAERIAARFAKPGMTFHGFARDYDQAHLPKPALRVGWTGRVELIPSKLIEPLGWRKPRRVFVNSMSDLFHEALSFADIERVYDVMLQAERHTFQVLTKRPERMLKFVRDRWLGTGSDLPANVWLGVSVEDQATADERIPLLLKTPAAVRFVSYEPALAGVDFRPWLGPVHPHAILDWLIVGGESGPGARPFDVTWARSAVRECREAGVPAFVKQLGARPFDSAGTLGPDECVDSMVARMKDRVRSPKGGNPAEWPADLRVREFPEVRP